MSRSCCARLSSVASLVRRTSSRSVGAFSPSYGIVEHPRHDQCLVSYHRTRAVSVYRTTVRTIPDQ